MEKDAVALAEESSKKDAVSAMTQKMKASLKTVGVDRLRHTILTYVAEEKYDRAAEELKNYLDSKSDYPMFKERAQRYVTYGVELIHAIRSKRSFPGWNALNMAKQKDLFEKAIEHFEDLELTLTKIEVIEKEVRVEDVRATVWVVQALFFCVTALVVFWFLREISFGLFLSAGHILDHSLEQMVDAVFDKIGW